MESKYFSNYVKTQKAMTRYTSCDLPVPPDIEIAAHSALRELRAYLQDNGMRMKPAKHHYDPYDKRTWKFIGINSSKKKPNQEMLNPEYKYA